LTGTNNVEMISNSKQKEIIILILCLLVGFALRFYAFDKKSLWIDEIHTFNESRDDLGGQLRYYQENPTHVQLPLFFILTHIFYPFSKPERDLRVIPLIFGMLSLPMIYFLSRSFSPRIALPCTLALALMTYHVHYSQEGRVYSLALFWGMAGLYFLMKHLETSKQGYLFFTGLTFSLLFYLSYSTVLFILLSQLLFFYRREGNRLLTPLRSLLVLNGWICLFCAPWFLFVVLNYRGQPIMDPLTVQEIGPFSSLLSAVLNDWASSSILAIVSVSLLILFPFVSNEKRNAFILLTMFIAPIGGLYAYCRLFHITQFITSRYFMNFLPLFFISLFMSADAMEAKWKPLRRILNPKLLFLLLFIASNLAILPLYYRSEKQDFRRLASYLHSQLQNGDRVFVRSNTYIPGILHYFSIYPEGRHYQNPLYWINSKVFEIRISLSFQDRKFTIYNSNHCCDQYVADGKRLWVLVGKEAAQEIQRGSPLVLKGYFDGSFSHFRRFPSDASMYLFLWDPKSPGDKGIEIPVE
jgi:uncharacterized membrane protein